MPPELLPANACAALTDLLAVGAVRQWPGVPIGDVLTWLRVVVVAVVVVAFGAWMFAIASDALVAIVVTIAFALGPWLVRGLAPPSAAAAIALWTIAALFVWWKHEGQFRADVSAILAIVAVVCVADVAALVGFVPALSRSSTVWSCLVPAANVARYQDILTAIATAVPADVLALAALGAFAESIAGGVVRVLTLVGVVIAASALTSARADVAATPMILAAWSTAAIGLRELLAFTGRGARGALATLLIVVAIPVLQAGRTLHDDRDDIAVASGHEKVSLAAMTSILNVLPPDAQIVEEDASIDLLLRAALIGGRRQTKPFSVVERRNTDVEAALQRGPVFAFPFGQAVLALRGFAIDRGPVAGIAAISGRRACVRLTSAWADLAGVTKSGRIALSVDVEAARGPVVLYVAGSTDYVPGAENWRPRVHAGFELMQFSRGTSASAERLQAEAREAGLVGNPVFDYPYVNRVIVRRSASGPLELPIALGPARPAAVGRLREDADDVPIRVCDAPPSSVWGF